MMETPVLRSEEWSARQAVYDEWVRTVRDPADATSEGLRRIVVSRAAAEYEIAPLPDGQWALRFGLEYRTGDFGSQYSPWTAYASREECVAAFLEAARAHFGAQLLRTAGATTQSLSRTAMLERLRDSGLFGFIEPNVEPNDKQTS
jgi:hypothetical protein